MDPYESHIHKHDLPKYNKKRLTTDQARLLESSFNVTKHLDPDRKSQLAQQLGLPSRQVAIWYQNKRARWKNQSLESDFNAQKTKLESVLAENKRLDREVERLRKELDKAQELLVSLNVNNNHVYNSSVSALSNSCDEVGSSSLDREFYECLIGGEGQFGKPESHNFFASSLSL
ncbi:homeobox-leucine zipper protein ATHB-52-like [Rhododendron vialii]|uniref:homeobox-leucine zipper protein ATHB-52-like n=1 Tax=Rhododendron vialii TaxID=182163 RepID=UPI00265D8DCD|nr:homeobox-leucine zipper protein ATHB-52-like [Rhododendron vialii]